MRFKMDTPAGRRLQLRECMHDIECAYDDEDDDLTQLHMLQARDALRTVLVLMEARETSASGQIQEAPDA